MQDPDFWENTDQTAIYKLRLFVNGTSVVSVRAISNLTKLLEQHLPGRYELEVIDANQHPKITQENNIAAIPTLIKLSPNPVRKLIGDMSDENKVLLGLGLV